MKKIMEWEIPFSELTVFYNRKLGEGSFGKAYLAKWRETLVVAKIMHSTCGDEQKELVLREFDTMTKLHHPNVVQLFGYVDKPFFCIVMEYFAHGNLLDNMKRMSQTRKLRIAQEISRGIYYLHKRQPVSIIHRDIKPSNVFLTDSFKSKIGDFGISKMDTRSRKSREFVEHDHDITVGVGTLRYMAPEVKGTAPYTNAIDIYSLGILFYELFEGRRYHPEHNMKWYKTPKKIRILISNMMSHKSVERPPIEVVYDVLNSQPPYMNFLKFKKKTLSLLCLAWKPL